VRFRVTFALALLAGSCALGVSSPAAGAGTGQIVLESTDSAGAPFPEDSGSGGSLSVADDGSEIAFVSTATNLVSPPPPEGSAQVYAKNLATGIVTLVSATSSGIAGSSPPFAGGGSTYPAISHNGRFVAFYTDATNLDPADTDALVDVYVKDLATGALTLASTNSAGVKGNGSAQASGLAVSDGGTVVAFQTMATNFDPRHTKLTCTVRDPRGGTTTRDCTHEETYAKNIATGALTLLTLGDTGHGGYGTLAVSADGTKVVFGTADALSPDDTDGQNDIYETDLTTGVVSYVSTNLPPGTADSSGFGVFPDASADGRRVAFEGGNQAGLPTFPTGDQIYVKDLSSGVMSVASARSDGVTANDIAGTAKISGDGRFVGFASSATNLDPSDGDSTFDVYLKSLDSGTVRLVSQRDDGVKANNYSFIAWPIDGGGSVLFESLASNLVVPATTGSSFLLKTFPVPEAPGITSPASASAGLRSPFDFKITTSGYPSPSLTESGALPPGLTLTDNGDGTAEIAGTAPVGSAGSYPMTLTATNGVGAAATQSFVLTVSSSATVPGFVAPAADTETFGVAFAYTINTTGYPVPKLTKSGALPAGVTFTANADGTATIAGTAAKAAAGVYPVTLTAKSTAGTTTETFSLTITKAPTINRIPTVSVVVGTPMAALTITAKGYEKPTLTLGASLPGGLTFTDNGNGTATLAGTPDSSGVGTQSLTVTASNSYGVATQTFTLNVNQRPAITSPTSATARVGQLFSFQATASGFPAPRISKTGTLPKGITFDASTGTFSGTPKATAAGSYPITITAKNKVGTATQTLTLIVS
jgi:Putative Ig domain